MQLAELSPMIWLRKAVIHPSSKMFAFLVFSLGMVGWSPGDRDNTHGTIELAGRWPGYARWAALDVRVQGDYAYVAARRAGFQIFEVKNPAQPKCVANVYTMGETRGVYVDGHLAYLTMASFSTSGCSTDATGQLLIVDISNPVQPVRLGDYHLSGPGESVTVAGKYAYVASGDAGMQVVDVSDPAKPIGICDVSPVGYANSVAVRGNYALLAAAGDGVQVVDVSNPAKPVLAGNYSTSDARDLFLAGQFAYVADAGAGLIILDVTKPEQPVLAGGYQVNGDFQAIRVAGARACLSANDGLHFFDVSNPAKPMLLGNFATKNEIGGMALSGNFAYVADGVFGVHVIDVNDAAHPVQTSYLETSASALNVQVVGRYAYVVESIGYCYG